MRNRKRKQKRVQRVNWREVGNGFLFAVMVVFIFVVLNGMGGN